MEVRDTALGSIPVFYDYCSRQPGSAWRRAHEQLCPAPESTLCSWGRKVPAPQAPPPATAPALSSPRPGIFPSLVPSFKPPGAPRAGPRGRGRGRSASVGARRGLVGFGEEEEEGVAIAEDKAVSRPGDRRGEWAGGSVASRLAEGIGAPLPCNRSAAGRAASSSLGLPGPATPGPVVLGQAADGLPRPCGSGPK